MKREDFVHIEVEPGPGAKDGLSMRFKRSGVSRHIGTVWYESEDGTGGLWEVLAVEDFEAKVTGSARAVEVEDSSDGVCWLVAGGAHGLVLKHCETGQIERVGYLLLSLRAISRSPT